MFTLTKTPGKDFIILNLTDPQLGSGEWEVGHKNRAILTYTVRELVKRVNPDLITVTGDISWAGDTPAYKAFADFIDAFDIPWAPVWGNHDNQNGPEFIDSIADLYLTCKNCLYEKGDPAIGNGNYVIAVKEGDKIVEGVIMMDSHDRMPYVNEKGEETNAWAKLIPEQLEWYKAQVRTLSDMGCGDTSIFMHIPHYAYRDAFRAAFAKDIEFARTLTPEESSDEKYWNDGYKDSFGLTLEDISSYPADEGALDAILEGGTTKTVVVGHDHINNTVINYKDVRHVYGTKAGAGCYWKPMLNGGTALRVTENGITDIWHEYVNVDDIVKMSDRLAYAIGTKFDLRCDEDGKFRVLCVSDLHARDDQWDPRLKLSLEALIKEHKPNLVFIAGDLCHDDGLSSEALLHDYMADVMEMCEKEGIAWAHVPGNHDREWGIPTHVFSEFPMNLSRRGPSDLSGYGTFALPVWPHDGDRSKGPAAMVWGFDSHMGIGSYADRHNIDKETFCFNNFTYSHDRYDSVNFNQAAWYYENSAELEAIYGRKIPGIMIMHACVAEMFLVHANPTRTKMEGICEEGLGGAVFNCGLFAAAYERGDIREMVAGHDHDNNLSGMYMGIRLTEDASIGFDVYGNNYIRGGRLMEFSENDPDYYATKHVYIKDLLTPDQIAGPHDFY